MNGSSPLRFVADKMLGSLAKKLRLLGIDTVYLKGADDGELRYILRSQSRILLTRNRKLVDSRYGRVWMVSGSGAKEEFLSIASKLSSADCRPAPFSLCLECNEPLTTIDPIGTDMKVPPYIMRSKTHFLKCSACQKVFWDGTHRKQMEKEVEWMKEVLEEEKRGNESAELG